MKTLHIKTVLPLLKKLYRFERCGKYDEALVELREIWEDTTKFPRVEEYESRTAAEVILRCGALIGFLGHNKQIPGSQEKSKNLLSEARNRFLDIYDVEKIAECENYLALAYWRTGELPEAKAWIEEALSHNLSRSNQVRLYSYIIEGKIDFANKNYEKICRNSAGFESEFLTYGDHFLKGNLYNNWGLALKNLGLISDAPAKLECGRDFYYKAKNKIHCALAENNLAQVYKSENDFIKAHEAIDKATGIFRQLKDRTREGFSLDTKAQIYYAEKNYSEALKTGEKAIAILTKSENKSYLVECLLTKAKTLLFLEDDISTAVMCLFDAVNIARTNISEESARELIREFEKARQEKNSPEVKKESAGEKISEKDKISQANEPFSEGLELVLPAPLANYDDLSGVWIANDHLEKFGLPKGSLAIVAQEEVKRGDLAALNCLAGDEIICGFYDADFGIVCLEFGDSDVKMFDEQEIEIFGKIIGVCRPEKNSGGKMFVEPINI